MNMPADKPELDKGSAPVRPGNRPLSFFSRSYAFLSSVKLALGLLVAILACCLIGVTIYRGARAGEMIFGTLWFNGLLILLVVNVAFCFFGRIWGRKMTLISLGMILFHLSFVAMLGGIIYNSLFYFRGTIRLTEGEVLRSGDPQSYDYARHGRYFSFAKLKGETALIKMHTGYKVDGVDKQVAYEVAAGEGRLKRTGIIYATHRFSHEGFDYFRDKEGYSLLVVLEGKDGNEIYSAYVPFQSIKQKNNSYLYVTGTMDAPCAAPFPQDPVKPLFGLQVTYHPSLMKEQERDGEAFFQIWTLQQLDAGAQGKAIAEGKAPIRGKVKVGDYYLSAREVRYWVGMTVRYEPGEPIVLASLWVALFGMIITFIGRMRRDKT